MELGIRGKVALVAAGSKGLGRAMALALAEEGCAVSICGRSEGSLRDTVDELKALGVPALGIQADISSPEDLRRWVEQSREALGPIDILITNTGGPKAANFGDLEDQDWTAGVDSTLLNVVRLCRAVLPDMQTQNWGRIVNLTSFVAKAPTPLLTISSTLRAGLSALTRTLALETAGKGITVNALLPGHYMTDRQVHLAELKAAHQGISLEASFAQTAAGIPAGRIGDPAELAAAAAFLCSARASYLTGQSLVVDGGLCASTF